jgi:hypothetical protein
MFAVWPVNPDPNAHIISFFNSNKQSRGICQVNLR